MRDPRPGIAWSTRRVATRATYRSYMGGFAWLHRRRLWLTTWILEHDAEPLCQICSARWTLDAGDLHHRSYRRLGHEPDGDLLPLCRDCHTALHALLDAPAWRRFGRARATDALVAVLRRRKGPNHD